jgi:hypothetical protein
MCDPCWDNRWQGKRTAVRLVEPENEKCCWCGQWTTSGIYVRADPDTIIDHVSHPPDITEGRENRAPWQGGPQ